jgi:hypothetical protein
MLTRLLHAPSGRPFARGGQRTHFSFMPDRSGIPAPSPPTLLSSRDMNGATERGWDDRVPAQRLRGVWPRAPRCHAVVPGVWRSTDRLHDASPLSGREGRLAKLGIAVGAESEGGVRSHARKAFPEGIGPEAIRHVAILAISTAGLPAAIPSFQCIKGGVGSGNSLARSEVGKRGSSFDRSDADEVAFGLWCRSPARLRASRRKET